MGVVKVPIGKAEDLDREIPRGDPKLNANSPYVLRMMEVMRYIRENGTDNLAGMKEKHGNVVVREAVELFYNLKKRRSTQL